MWTCFLPSLVLDMGTCRRVTTFKELMCSEGKAEQEGAGPCWDGLTPPDLAQPDRSWSHRRIHACALKEASGVLTAHPAPSPP